MQVKFQGSVTLGELADEVNASLPEAVREIELKFECSSFSNVLIYDADHFAFGSGSRMLMEALLGVEIGEAIRLAVRATLNK